MDIQIINGHYISLDKFGQIEVRRPPPRSPRFTAKYAGRLTLALALAPALLCLIYGESVLFLSFLVQAKLGNVHAQGMVAQHYYQGI